MSGTIPLSLTQQFDVYGQPLAGGQLYIIQAGTVSTPQDAFQDTALTIKQPYPMLLDAAGRVPQFFLADPSSGGNATVKVRLQDKNGVVQLSSDGILVIGPSGGTGGGGGTAVDPSAIYQTGDIKPRYGTGVHPGVTPGWVRANGLTIGSASASPGATERGNADCQALFNYLWQADSTLAVIPSRGSSSSADWTANKTIATPDFRGYALSGLDDMGNSAAGRLTGSYWGGSPTTLGSVGGGEQNTLTAAQVPAISSAGSVSVISANSYFRVQAGASIIAISAGTGTSGILAVPQGNVTDVETVSSSGSFSANSNNTGGQAFRTIGPRKLCTFYIKL